MTKYVKRRKDSYKTFYSGREWVYKLFLNIIVEVTPFFSISCLHESPSTCAQVQTENVLAMVHLICIDSGELPIPHEFKETVMNLSMFVS